MISKGNYRVVQVLDVSVSLNSQKNEQPEMSENSIKKCILVNDSKQIVAYFVDLAEIGQNSEITILKDLEIPLIYKKDIKIEKKREYVHNYNFIQKLSKS